MHDLPAMRLEDLESQTAQLLPQRATLCQFGCTSVVNVVGVNLSIAVNAATINSSAHAVAAQYLTSVHP